MVIKMKVVIGTDHNGTNIKKEIIRFLNNRNIEVVDVSEHNSAVDDYPLYAFAAAKKVVDKECEFGILLCGTGIGMSIAANKVKGIRCAHVTNVNEASLARKHNNANVMAIGKNNRVNDILKMVDIFITTQFSKEERHRRRVDIINKYENGEYNV